MKIDELHDHLFEVLCTIDDVCTKYGASYFLCYGTELGAVREKDFIPWDDDMDLQVLWSDYPKFKEAMEKGLPEYMHLIEPDIFTPYFYDFVVRVYDERYKLRKENDKDNAYNNYENYVGTDIFIVCEAPKSKLGQKAFLFKNKVLYGLGMGHRSDIDYSKYSMIQKIQVCSLSTIGKLISSKSICKKWFDFINKNKGTGAYCNVNSPLRCVKILPSRIFEGKDYATIRNRKFPVFKGYDEELTIFYGNYMQPPKDMNYYVQHLDEEDRTELANRYNKRVEEQKEEEK